MAKYASKVVEQAKAWVGYNEYDGSHKKIIGRKQLISKKHIFKYLVYGN